MAFSIHETESASRRRPEKTIILSDTALNSSSKALSFNGTVNEGTRMRIVGVRVEYTATATVGTRRLVLEITSETDVVGVIQISASITAGTSVNFHAAPGLAAGGGSDVTHVNLPNEIYVMAAGGIRVRDVAAVDAAADDMVVHVTGVVD